MTTEHVILVDLGDLHGLRMVCGKCGAAILFKLNETIRNPGECPGCRTPWLGPSGHNAADAVFHALTKALKEWIEIERRAPAPGYRVQFEIQSETR